jgi:hypothetical protein
MNDDLDDTAEIKDIGARLTSLGNLAVGLGSAIQGLCSAGNTIAAKDFVEQLSFVAKRLSWLEKQTDPTWRPFDPSKPDRRGRVRDGRGPQSSPDSKFEGFR